MQLPAVQEGQSCPKLFSSDNNMDPGSVPAELQGLSQTEEMLIARSCPIMRVIHLKGGQLGSDARPNQLQQKSPTGSLAPAVPVAITPTFSPWTHTSDDSYIYQLSLVLATAIVSFSFLPPAMSRASKTPIPGTNRAKAQHTQQQHREHICTVSHYC